MYFSFFLLLFLLGKTIDIWPPAQNYRHFWPHQYFGLLKLTPPPQNYPPLNCFCTQIFFSASKKKLTVVRIHLFFPCTI
ncbi:uncharacterized protein BYT42DRAFT_568261 [Radiomyces spectabilis]|uniref:uncharacterized protein n=1 Tax=Radiomyces spectabilis TaxID=64574 RepID=UPI00221FC42F|nr:uncharacterized protein BYT42DRAFT_568261 [Radiomyces spectabilis]KAI8379265.1 hypothetical protein BYT42DRAFT_568261 [Radiomyces spectabilis]